MQATLKVTVSVGAYTKFLLSLEKASPGPAKNASDHRYMGRGAKFSTFLMIYVLPSQNLPHLFSPGMKFSLKGAVLVAALCHLTDNKHLADRARKYLEEKKGRYLNLDKVNSK